MWVVVGAVLAHATQGGGAPPLVALLPVVATTSAVVWWAGSRRLHFVAALALLGLSQVAVHLLSSYVHGHVMTPAPAMAVAHLAALVVVAAGIAKVDQLWWAWWDRATLIVRLADWSAPVQLAGPVPVAPRAREHGAELAHVVVRRGPPAS
jgi:hypothetical protein